MTSSSERDEQNILACRILTTLPSSIGQVRLVFPAEGCYQQIRFEQKTHGGFLRHRSDFLDSGSAFGNDLARKGRRLFILNRDDAPDTKECLLPILFGVHVLGWVGAPLPRMDYWNQYLRGYWARWIRSFADRLAHRQIARGKTPLLEFDGPILEKKSLRLLASRLSDDGEIFGMVYVRPDKLDMSDALADILRASVREGDAVGAADTGATALCLGGSPEGIRSRMHNLLSDAVELDWRLSSELRFGTCDRGRFKDVSIQRIRPLGRPVAEHSSRLSATFRRLGLITSPGRRS